ncbi:MULTISPECIES: hypothetical protein [Bacillus]|nr:MULTISPECIES: hypothetical protein [Bacillus]MED1410961.1 hypothetical protein [Bacillus paramycoides]MED1466201.1 hypothetical protein [Bacillus paramycoides]MED1492999.1 hypothetical protein [Bacillus paramycoides]
MEKLVEWLVGQVWSIGLVDFSARVHGEIDKSKSLNARKLSLK